MRFILAALLSFCASVYADVKMPLKFISNPLVASLQTSRVSGVAPLYVQVDMSGTTSTATSRPFHDIQYTYDFGDNDTLTWALGAQPGVSKRNRATGPVAGHVYEIPGTYALCGTAKDGTNPDARLCQNITVSDPEVVFAGNATVCVNPVGDAVFTGCPSSQHSNTNDQITAKALISSSVKRLLFKCGGTWTTSTIAEMDVTGPGLIGAYNASGQVSISNPTCTAPVMRSNGTATIWFMSGAQCCSVSTPSDWRVMDLDLDGQSQTGFFHAVEFEGGMDQVTLLRLHVHHVGNGIQFERGLLDVWNADASSLRHGHHVWDQLAIQDVTVDHIFNAVGNGAFIAAKRMSMMGVSITTSLSGGQHVFRYTWGVSSDIANSNFFVPRQSSPCGLTLKLHAPDFAGDHVVPAGSYSEMVVISDNKMVSAQCPNMVDFGAQNNVSNERVRNVIYERNWMQHSLPGDSNTQVIMAGSDITVRDNLLDATGSDGLNGAIMVTALGNSLIATPNNNAAINNTIYMGNASSLSAPCPCGQLGILVSNDAQVVTNTSVINNLFYGPLTIGAPFITDNGSGTTMSGNTCNANGCTTRVTTSPSFASGSPVNPVDFKPTGGSYAIGSNKVVTTTAAPVWSDFFLAPQPSPRDIGAVNH